MQSHKHWHNQFSSFIGNVGDWTFGSSPHPQKCSLTCLQGHNEMEPSIPEGIGRTLRSASSETMTFGPKDITFWRPKATGGCTEAPAQTPRPLDGRVPLPSCRRWRPATRKNKLDRWWNLHGPNSWRYPKVMVSFIGWRHVSETWICEKVGSVHLPNTWEGRICKPLTL